jgi:hypothetical protein
MNIQNVTAPPSFSSITGVSWVINTTPIQRINVANDIANPLVFVGNISDMITHGIGPKEEANDAK